MPELATVAACGWLLGGLLARGTTLVGTVGRSRLLPQRAQQGPQRPIREGTVTEECEPLGPQPPPAVPQASDTGLLAKLLDWGTARHDAFHSSRGTTPTLARMRLHQGCQGLAGDALPQQGSPVAVCQACHLCAHARQRVHQPVRLPVSSWNRGQDRVLSRNQQRPHGNIHEHQ